MRLTIGPFVFAPRLVPTLAAVAFVALTVWLGRWQLHRAEEKEGRQAVYEARMREPALRLAPGMRDPAALLFRRVRASGRWIPEGQVYVDNRVHEGRAGFEVVTPLRLAGSREAVLVDRGWVPRGPRYPRAPAVPVPPGDVAVAGIATLPPKRFLELSSETVEGNVIQNLSIARYARRTGLAVLPVVVLADAPAPGLVRVPEAPDAGASKHREYEVTWFSMALTAAALWVGLNVRRRA